MPARLALDALHVSLSLEAPLRRELRLTPRADLQALAAVIRYSR